MDPLALASLSLSLITPFVTKGAEAFAEEAGKDLYENTKKLKNWLWKKIRRSNDKKLKLTATQFESDPRSSKEAMVRTLAEYLRHHPREAEQLAHQVRSMNRLSSTYSVKIQGSKVFGMNVGDNPTVFQNFFTDDDD
jgi:hypothetical protein